MPENGRIRQEINPQLWMLNAVNRAILMRQESPNEFPHAVAGAWCSLFPWMKEELVEKLDRLMPNLSPKQIKNYDEDGFETSFDLFASLESQFNGKKEKTRIKASEILLTKIMEVMQGSGILGSKREMPTTTMKRRTLNDESE